MKIINRITIRIKNACFMEKKKEYIDKMLLKRLYIFIFDITY